MPCFIAKFIRKVFSALYHFILYTLAFFQLFMYIIYLFFSIHLLRELLIAFSAIIELISINGWKKLIF